VVQVVKPLSSKHETEFKLQYHQDKEGKKLLVNLRYLKNVITKEIFVSRRIKWWSLCRKMVSVL
jgi:hypothetical protein